MWRKVTKFDISRKIRATRELKLSSSCVEYLELSQHSRTPFGTTAVSNQPMCDNACAVAEAIVSTSPEEYEEMRELNSEMSMQRRKEVQTFPAKERSVIHGMSQGKHNALRKRQTMVETEAWNEAAREYQEFLTIMCEKKLFPNLPPIKSLFLGRSEPLRDAINAEQDLCKTGKNRGGYAPYFDELPAVMMKVITMQKLMGLSMSSGCHGSATLASIQIGEAIEHGLAIPEEPDTDEETAIRKWKWKDGSCNGLQHYAALGRDKVDTKLVKQTVMTSVYGVPYIGTQDQIKRRLKACDAIADTEVFAAVCYAAKVMIEVAIPSSMVMLPKFPVETIVLSNLYAAVAMKTSNGDYFRKCDAFHLSMKWSTESDSFVILDNTADSFHKNRLKKVERSDLDHKAACSWISLYVSSPGQAILHATFSKPIDFGFSRQIVLKASASIASFLPVTVHQPGDGNNIGGYWFDLEKGNNDRSGISDELFLVRGASLDVILVGGPRGWEKGVDLVETVDILYERSPYNIKGLVYQVPILEGNGYRVLCQKAGNFTVILKRGNLIGDDHQESVVAKTNLHLECSFPSSIVVLADITVNKLDVIQNAILADIGAGYLLSTPVTVANGRTIGVSALGISMSGKASANEPRDSEVPAVGWGRNRALKNASGQDGSIAIIEPETHAVDGTELANLRPPEDDDIAIIAPELYPLDEIKLGNLRAPEWLYQSTVKQLRPLYPTIRVVVHTDASLKKMDGVGWVCSMAHVGRDIETGEIIWYATGFCDVVSGDSNVGELIGMVYAVYLAKCLGIEELILKCDNEHSLKMVKKALRDVKNKEMIELYLRLQELLEGMNVTPLWISDEAEKQVADCLSRAEMNGGVDRKKLISKFLKLVERDIKSKRKLD